MYYDNKFYFGLENNGIKIYDKIEKLWYTYIPNTIYKNQFDAIALTKRNHLVGIVNHKYSINIDNITSLR